MSNHLQTLRRDGAPVVMAVLMLGTGSFVFAKQASPPLPPVATATPSLAAAPTALSAHPLTAPATPALAATAPAPPAFPSVATATQARPLAAPARPPASSALGGGVGEVDIRDIRGAKPVASPWLMPLLALSGLLAAAGLYGIWRWSRRPRATRKTLMESAMERLDAASGLMLPDTGREFAIDVSNIVREYIESRFEVRASHLTTDEFLRSLSGHKESMLAAHSALLNSFLQTCDLGKFGGWRLSMSDMTTMLERAREFVIASAEKPDMAKPGRVQRDQAQRADAQPDSSPSRTGETYVSFPST